MPQDLVNLARSGQLDKLEEGWTEALSNPGDVSAHRRVLEALCEQDMAGRALALAAPMIDALAENGRVAEAVELATTVVRRNAHNDSLGRRLRELLDRRFGSQDWYPLIRDLAALPDSISTQALENFERLCRYTAGHVVYHRGGWGEGVVTEFRPHAREVVIQFATGKVSELPLSTALESFTPLDDEDLRTMRLLHKDELLRLAEEDPASLIRKAAKLFRGKITSVQLKETLSPSVVPTSKWAAFWKRAKASAAVDPYLQVEGSSTRPTFVLRKRPLSLIDEARRAMSHADGLGGALAVARDYLERSPDEPTRQQILDVVQERLEAAIARGEQSAHAHVLDGILLMEEHARSTSGSSTTELRGLLLDAEGQLHPEALEQLATQEAREHAVRLLPDAIGERWADMFVDAVTRVPASVLEPLADALQHSGQGHKLLRVWRDVVPYPRRYPVQTYLLGKLYAEGVFDSPEAAAEGERPDPISVGRVLLHLVRVLTTDRRGTAEMRLRTKLVTLLTGRRALLARILENIDRDTLASFLGITDRGGEDFPQEITDMILRAVADKYPDITAKPDRPFWELDYIYVTADGLRRQREEYRVMVEQKIPDNSRAIGAAAALGDLSENSEWESAMEEQRNLTTRATTMDQELRKARLIEDQDLPEGRVAPGTRVTFTYVDRGQSRTVRILGPWDVVDDDVINYRAPMARGLLGKAVGEMASIDSPQGREQVRIDRVEKLV